MVANKKSSADAESELKDQRDRSAGVFQIFINGYRSLLPNGWRHYSRALGQRSDEVAALRGIYLKKFYQSKIGARYFSVHKFYRKTGGHVFMVQFG